MTERKCVGVESAASSRCGGLDNYALGPEESTPPARERAREHAQSGIRLISEELSLFFPVRESEFAWKIAEEAEETALAFSAFSPGGREEISSAKVVFPLKVRAEMD